jgi:hypothetical protein
MSPRPICLAVALAASLGWAGEDPSRPIKANASRLVFVEGVAYLAKRGTREPSEKPFTGVAFEEGDNWRAEVPYKDGIKDGEVFVIKDNRIVSRFRYDKGRKILPE